MKRWLEAITGGPKMSAIPTVDYYFLGAMEDLVTAGDATTEGRPVRRLGPHTFASHTALVVIRYATDGELRRIEAARSKRVYYVLDDMLPIAKDCAELPAAYRERLAGFADRVLPRILAVEPTIVAPSAAILALFDGRPRERLDPMALDVARDFDHFDGAIGPRMPLRLAFLGTRSHGEGIAFLSPVLADVVRAGVPFTLTLFFGKHLPESLARLPGIDNRAALGWPEFRRLMSRERFHGLLAPLLATPFNAGRSITKVLDAAAVGACGLYSDRPPFAGVVEDGVAGLLLPDRADAWSAAIARLGSDLVAARRLASAGAALATRVGDRARVRRFWLERLGIG